MRLFDRCSSGEMSDLTQCDNLLGILYEGAVPHWATMPPEDVFARYEAIQSQMEHLRIDGQSSAFPPIRSEGWSGVFSTIRVLLRTVRAGQQTVAAPEAALQQSNDGGGSFGRGALHLLTQRQSSSLPQSSAVGATSEMQTAVLTAAAAIDAESRLPVGHRPIFQAVDHVNSISAGVDGTDMARLRAVGAAFENLPQAALQLDNSGGASYNPMASSCMLAVSTALTSSSAVLARAAARAMRAHMARDGPEHAIPEKRKTDTQTVVRLLIRGKPLEVDLKLLYGTDGDLFSVIASSSSQSEWEASLGVLQCLQYTVSLFYSPFLVSGEASNFFGAAYEVARKLRNEEAMPPQFVAAYLKDRTKTLQSLFDDFYRGTALERPRYASSLFYSAESISVLNRVRGDVLRDLQMRVQAGAPALLCQQSPAQPQQSPVVQLAPPPQMPAFAPPPQFMQQQFVPQQQFMPQQQQYAPQQLQPQQLQWPYQPDASPIAPSPKKKRGKKPKAAAASPAVLPAAPAAPAAVRCAMAAGAAQPATRTPAALNAAPLIGGPAHNGPATPGEMRAFTVGNPGRGGGMCFDFWRRGICHRGVGCKYEHAQ